MRVELHSECKGAARSALCPERMFLTLGESLCTRFTVVHAIEVLCVALQAFNCYVDRVFGWKRNYSRLAGVSARLCAVFIKYFQRLIGGGVNRD